MTVIQLFWREIWQKWHKFVKIVRIVDYVSIVIFVSKLSYARLDIIKSNQHFEKFWCFFMIEAYPTNDILSVWESLRCVYLPYFQNCFVSKLSCPRARWLKFISDDSSMVYFQVLIPNPSEKLIFMFSLKSVI